MSPMILCREELDITIEVLIVNQAIISFVYFMASTKRLA
jgi:hypothetical protein